MTPASAEVGLIFFQSALYYSRYIQRVLPVLRHEQNTEGTNEA